VTAGDDEDGGPVRLPTEDSLDLHAFAPRDVRAVVESYLEAAIEAGFEEVRLIHGRGIGVQREIVRSVLSRHPRVREFLDATPDRGGWGATIVRLRLDLTGAGAEPTMTEPEGRE
jgi:dsDNA-specific endonuclease/ATPase MutS2